MAVIEVSLLKLFKRSIFIVYQGSDARQNDYCEKNFEISMPYKSFTKTGSIEFDEMKRESISFYSKVADKIYSLNPDLLHVLPKSAEFLPYSHINLNDWLPVYIQNENTPLRIGHAPSNKGLKGTSFIIKAIENLKRRGCDIEFVLIEGISNEKAKQLYKSLDLVIDQLLSGWYGGLAVEAMALGKPVVAYIRHSDLHFIDPIMKQELPIYEANPQTIEKVLEGIIKLPRRELYRRGVASRKFVENWHNPMKIGNKIKCDIIQASKNFH
jgi:glycosyltransferase involved in cell wall biosynthesis